MIGVGWSELRFLEASANAAEYGGSVLSAVKDHIFADAGLFVFVTVGDVVSLFAAGADDLADPFRNSFPVLRRVLFPPALPRSHLP